MKVIKQISSIAIIGISILVILVGLSSIETVKRGHVKVVTKFGGVTERVLYPGNVYFIWPIMEGTVTYNVQKIIYETRRTVPEKKNGEGGITIDYAVDTNTKDGQQVNVYFTIRFAVDRNMAGWVAENIGTEESLIDKVIRPEARIWARNIPREYEAAELYSGKLTEVSTKIEDILRPIYAENGIELDSVGVREIEFESQYVNAIEAKQIEFVNIETAQNRAEAAKYEKEQVITEAEAKSTAQKLQQEALGAEIIEKTKLEQWDGKLPTTITIIGGDADVARELIMSLP